MIKTNIKITERSDKIRGIINDLSRQDFNAVDIGLFAEQDSHLIMYASANEFGVPSSAGSGLKAGWNHTITIPERSFLRSSFDENKGTIKETIKSNQIKVLLGQVTKNMFLKRLGEYMKSMVQKKIIDGPFKDNAESTVARKGSNRPLIDTGRMRQSVTYRLMKYDKDHKSSAIRGME